MTVSFVAKYDGRCGRCRLRFSAGAKVYYEEDEVVLDHDCQDDGPPLAGGGDKYDEQLKASKEIGHKPKGVCPRCFLVHVGECL